MSRSVTILGATGSVGTSTLDLIERQPDDFTVEALTAQTDVAGLAAAARRTRARLAVIGDPRLGVALEEALAGSGTQAAAGADAIVDAAARGADWTMAAIVGCAGLRPVMAALGAGGTVALANKESLVSAGAIVMDAARRHKATLLPVDSEHNAIFQCFDHAAPEHVRRIILTASGGPFRTFTRVEMADVTPARAVKHPNWSMGAKISVDSATMMNLVHPQSVIHSMVEYVDGSILAQLGTPDMRTPIAHALAWPKRMAAPVERLDFAKVGRFDFEAPDTGRFPAIALARAAIEAGGARPAVLNAANEVAVAAFLAGRVGFLDIAVIVGETLDRYDPAAPESLDDVIAIDGEARIVAERMMEAKAA